MLRALAARRVESTPAALSEAAAKSVGTVGKVEWTRVVTQGLAVARCQQAVRLRAAGRDHRLVELAMAGRMGACRRWGGLGRKGEEEAGGGGAE